jgi:hypothetical protein
LPDNELGNYLGANLHGFTIIGEAHMSPDPLEPQKWSRFHSCLVVLFVAAVLVMLGILILYTKIKAGSFAK